MRKVYVAVIALSVVLCGVFGFMFAKDYFFSAHNASSDSADKPRENRQEELTLAAGSAAVIELSDADEAALTKWMVGNSEIAVVDSGGRIDARKEGTTDVTAAFSDGHAYTYRLTVTAPQEEPAVDRFTSALTANQDILKKNLSSDSEKHPYEIHVNRKQNCVTVYTYDKTGAYTVPVRAMICSCGVENRTHLGTFSLYFSTKWHPLVNDVFGQYASSFDDDLLFHSVPYYHLSKDSLETEEFNKLGTFASRGCVRMTVADCQWICENCAPDTGVIIYDDDNPGPLGKPEMVRITDHTCGWDPTDRDMDNPYRTMHPKISGAQSITLQKGSDYDMAQNITATDTCGNDITDKITITGNVRTDRPGTYRVTYRVTDAINRTAQEDITVTVKE